MRIVVSPSIEFSRRYDKDAVLYSYFTWDSGAEFLTDTSVSGSGTPKISKSFSNYLLIKL